MTSRAVQRERSFGVKVVEKVISDVLDAFLHNVKYESLRCSRLSHDMCSIIKDKVKELQGDDERGQRKLVVYVMVGQDVDQTVRFASRCLWDVEQDSMASSIYRNNSLFAVGVVFWIGN